MFLIGIALILFALATFLVLKRLMNELDSEDKKKHIITPLLFKEKRKNRKKKNDK